MARQELGFRGGPLWRSTECAECAIIGYTTINTSRRRKDHVSRFRNVPISCVERKKKSERKREKEMRDCHFRKTFTLSREKLVIFLSRCIAR